MRNFTELDILIDWKNLAQKVGSDICALYLRDDLNFTFAWGQTEEFLLNSTNSLETF